MGSGLSTKAAKENDLLSDDDPRLSYLQDLPEELIREIVKHFSADLPSLTSLALVSKRFRKRLWPYRGGEFNNLEFLDACARLGYLNLLKEAFQSGSLLDEKVLDVAVLANQTAVTKWLVSVLPKKQIAYYKSRFSLKAAASGNLDLLAFFVDDTKVSLEKIAVAAAEGGHAALAVEYRLKCSSGDFIERLNFRAAKNGFMEAALALCDSDPPSSIDFTSILEGGCVGGHLDIMRIAADHGGKADVTFLSKRGVLLDVVALDFICNLLPAVSSRNQTELVTLACDYPNKEVFEWIVSKGYTFVDGHAKLLLCGYNLKFHMSEVREELERTRDGRFRCVKYLHSLGNRWNSLAIRNVTLWATLEQTQWIISMCSSPLLPSHLQTMLLNYLSSHVIADMAIVRYFVELGADVNHEILFQSFLVGNNLEVLQYFDERYEPDFFEGLLAAVTTLGSVMSEIFNGTLSSMDETSTPEGSYLVLPPLRRMRPVNLLEVVKWIVSHGIIFSPSAIYEFKKISKEPFTSEFAILLGAKVLRRSSSQLKTSDGGIGKSQSPRDPSTSKRPLTSKD